MKTTTYKKVTEENGMMQFVKLAVKPETLSENQFYALMVEDDNYPRNNSPHVKGIEAYYHRALVGIEKTTRKNENEGVYISKEFNKRKNLLRGSTIIVEVAPTDMDKFCVI